MGFFLGRSMGAWPSLLLLYFCSYDFAARASLFSPPPATSSSVIVSSSTSGFPAIPPPFPGYEANFSRLLARPEDDVAASRKA